MRTVRISITGESGPLDEYNPFLVLDNKFISRMLYVLNRKPMDVYQLQRNLKIKKETILTKIDDLLRVNAIREENGRYFVNFPIFTVEDLMMIAERTAIIGRKLANEIMKVSDKLSEISSSFTCIDNVEKEKVLFAIIGCFALDWLGLKLLEEEGFLVYRKAQPGNRSYVLFGEETARNYRKNLNKVYCGSHTIESENIYFTSFGDHTGVRYAFPDILWTANAVVCELRRKRRNKPPNWYVDKILEQQKIIQQKILRKSSFILFEINKRGTLPIVKYKKYRDILNLLADMGYIRLMNDEAFLNWPVFMEADIKPIKEVCNLIGSISLNFVRSNFREWQVKFANITPMKNKIDFKESFNMIWHWIFGQTNKTLAENGFIHDPQPKMKGEARYIAWTSKVKYPN